MPLAPKARAGRRWRHGYYTVLSWGGRVDAREGKTVGGDEAARPDGGVGLNHGWGREVSTLWSGHPYRRRRRRRRRRRVLASLITAAAPPGQTYTFSIVVTRQMRLRHHVTTFCVCIILIRARVYDDRKM